MTDQVGLTLNKAASVSSIAGVFSLVGAVGGSYIVGRFFHNKEKIVVSVMSILGTASIFAAYFASSVALLTVLMGIANFLLTLTFVSMMSIPLKIFTGSKFAPRLCHVGNRRNCWRICLSNFNWLFSKNVKRLIHFLRSFSF